jgi:hypothetical protein
LRELCRFTGRYEFIGSDTTATQTRRGNQGEDPGSEQRAFPNSGRAHKSEDCDSRPEETQRYGEKKYRGGSASKVGEVSGGQEIGCGKCAQDEKQDEELRNKIEALCKDEGILGSKEIAQEVAIPSILDLNKLHLEQAPARHLDRRLPSVVGILFTD